MDKGEPSYEEDFFKRGMIIQMGSRDGNDRDDGANGDDRDDGGNGDDDTKDYGNGNDEDKEEDGDEFFLANEEREGEDIGRKM